MQAALAGGVKVNTDVKVESVDVSETVIILASGETIFADLIIAADGLHVGYYSLSKMEQLSD